MRLSGRFAVNPSKDFSLLKLYLEISLSRNAFLSSMRDGRYPKPVKLTKRSAAWRVSDIKALCEKLGAA